MDTHERIANALETIASANNFLTPLHSLLAVPGSALAGRRPCHVAEHLLAQRSDCRTWCTQREGLLIGQKQV